MAETLSPELLKILQGLGQTGGYADPTSGMYYQGTFSGQGGGEDTGYLTGYTASGGPTDVKGARADTFGMDGKHTGNIDAYDPEGAGLGTFGKILALTLGGMAGGAALSGMGMMGGAGGMGGGGSLDLGLGAASGGYEGFAADSLLQNLAAESGAGAVGATGAANAATSTPGMFDSVKSFLPEGVKSYLGPAATLAGGLLGAKGNEQSSTSTKSLDPRMDPLVYGQGGLSSKIQDLLNRQTSKSGLLGKYWS